jgi:ABC-type sugar transport system ATPase subunit
VSAAPPLLALHGIVKEFPGTRALDAIDCSIEAGTVHALVGENGAGKSTLVKLLAGDLQPDAGRIEMRGRRVTIPDPRSARALGIAVVHQELALAADLSVAENLLLGRWPRRHGLVDRQRMHDEAQAALAIIGARLDPRASIRGLSVAARQQVEIARALSLESQLLVLDEPSAVLTPRELESLFEIVRRATARGVGVIYISHRLEEIFELADQVTVLRDGRRVATHAVAEVGRDGLVAEMVGRDIAASPAPRASARVGVSVLQVEALSAGRRCRNISFEVSAGEILALAGLVGAGRSSLLGAIFGAVHVTAGSLRVGEVQGPFASPRTAIAAGIAYVPEDRKLQGLLVDRSVRENVTLARLRDFARRGLLDLRRERAATQALLDELRIKARHQEVPARTLSGGNQQKVLLARWMGQVHRVVLLDEPTRGVDVGAKAEIHALVRQLAASGAAVVVASSDLPEVLELGDRVAVLCDGSLVGLLDNTRRQVDPQMVLRLATGGERAA